MARNKQIVVKRVIVTEKLPRFSVTMFISRQTSPDCMSVSVGARTVCGKDSFRKNRTFFH